jgi:hypothetical protein
MDDSSVVDERVPVDVDEEIEVAYDEVDEADT